MIKIQLTSKSLEIHAGKSDGVYPFVATITHGGKPSDKFVGGTDLIKGGPYRVIIPTSLLNTLIANLEGKGVFAAEGLDGHANSTCIGEFVSAWVEEDDDGQARAKASGIIYRVRNPEVVDQLIEEARAGRVGFSYDLKNVEYKTEELELGAGNTLEKLLILSNFQWRGATALFKAAAAYEETQLAAQKIESKEIDMDAKELQAMFNAALTPIVTDLKQAIDGIKTELKNDVALVANRVEGLEKNKPAETPVPQKQESKMNLSDFAASISKSVGDAVKEAIKPVVEANSNAEPKGVRRSISAQDIEFYGKFEDKKEGDEMTVQDIDKKIEKVCASTAMTNSQKAAELKKLGTAKRSIIKQQILHRGYAQ